MNNSCRQFSIVCVSRLSPSSRTGKRSRPRAECYWGRTTRKCHCWPSPQWWWKWRTDGFHRELSMWEVEHQDNTTERNLSWFLATCSIRVLLFLIFPDVFDFTGEQTKPHIHELFVILRKKSNFKLWQLISIFVFDYSTCTYTEN